MPRSARLDIPGLPRHLCVRGINGAPCFTSDQDRSVFLKYLREALQGTGCSLHGFVLMTNHVHLLATAREQGAVSAMMHSVGLRYARYFNRSQDRTGHLFNGRFWSSHIENERYFFQTMRYIELNPVRAAMVDDPGRYPWSSYLHNTGREMRKELVFHDEYLHLGITRADCARAWAGFVGKGINPDELTRIRKQFTRNRPLGSPAFEEELGTCSRTRPQITS